MTSITGMLFTVVSAHILLMHLFSSLNCPLFYAQRLRNIVKNIVSKKFSLKSDTMLDSNNDMDPNDDVLINSAVHPFTSDSQQVFHFITYCNLYFGSKCSISR